MHQGAMCVFFFNRRKIPFGNICPYIYMQESSCFNDNFKKENYDNYDAQLLFLLRLHINLRMDYSLVGIG